MTPHQVASLLEVDLPQAQELLEALLKENLLTVVGQNSYDEWLASQQPKIQLDEVTVIHEEKQESVFTSVETTSEEAEITSEEPQEEHTKLNEFSAPFYPEVIVDTDFEEEVSLIIG